MTHRRPALVLTLALLALANTASAQAPASVDCSPPFAACPLIAIAGDNVASTPTFKGFADPGLIADPARPGRIWMAYSYLGGRLATGADGRRVGVPHVATHLARSDDSGASWRFDSVLWDSELVADPEGRGPMSYFGSETPSLAALRGSNDTTWFSVRLHYFLEPESAYKPRYSTGWTMRVARAQGESPAALARAEEQTLGVRTTARGYGADVDLNAIAVELRDCAMWNNPAVFAQGPHLHLVAECLVFAGQAIVAARTRMVLLSTEHASAARQWRWRYLGVLADHATARDAGGERLVSGTIARGRDGALLLIASPHEGVSVIGRGCVVLELESLDPPRLRRDPAGAPVVRARQTGLADRSRRTGACSYDAASVTGIVTVTATSSRGLQTELRATGLRP
ncbi:MAG: hypothetical protein FJX57_04550 [Alphaproteobacteria bacterium]|nr:hypothetical protein [Alphaproteobacteria bacterium]